MPEKGIRSTYSQCPFQIQMWDEQGIISTGSAFFYELNNDWFLITNWHSFSGRHFISRKLLYSSERTPTFLKVKLFSHEIHGMSLGGGSFLPFAQEVAIYKGLEPLWFEHPKLSSSCDVVALPMERPQSCPPFMHNAANLISKVRIPVQPGCLVFVIGFPSSISVGPGLPLWKSGYIASEPYYGVTINGRISHLGGLQGGIKLPAFFIDSQTREGMSGSPVFASYAGIWNTSNPYEEINVDEPGFWNRDDIALWGSQGVEFIGCYSGRVGVLEEGAALGLCWRKDVIEHICSSRKRAQNPHI